MGRGEDLFDRLERGGIAYLDELIETHKSEEAFLDFKRSKNSGQSTHLEGDDQKNLSRALSGFANSDGGVVVWGVRTGDGSPSGGADTASGKAPLRDCRAFAAAIDNAISGRTNPPVPGARSIPLPESDGSSGFVATLIPASSIGPHQTVDTKVYLARYGSSQNRIEAESNDSFSECCANGLEISSVRQRNGSVCGTTCWLAGVDRICNDGSQPGNSPPLACC
jgi:hypothetical protein